LTANTENLFQTEEGAEFLHGATLVVVGIPDGDEPGIPFLSRICRASFRYFLNPFSAKKSNTRSPVSARIPP